MGVALGGPDLDHAVADGEQAASNVPPPRSKTMMVALSRLSIGSAWRAAACPSAMDPERNRHRSRAGWTLRTVAAILAVSTCARTVGTRFPRKKASLLVYFFWNV
jgi:hypothetical protein